MTNGATSIDWVAGSSSTSLSVTDTRYGSTAASGYPLTGTSVAVGALNTPVGYEVTVDNPNAPAEGTVTVTAQLVDSNGDPVPAEGRTVYWSSSYDGSPNASNSDPVRGILDALSSTTDVNGIATITFDVSVEGGHYHTVTATDDPNATNPCSGSPCTGTSEQIDVGVTLVGLPSNRPANAQSTTVTFQYPADVRAGDLILVAVNLSNSGGGDPSLATLGGGFTQWQKIDNIAGQLSMRVLYKFATGNEDGDEVTITVNPMQRVGGSLMVYRNADPTNPLVGFVSENVQTPQAGVAPFAMPAPATTTFGRKYSRTVSLYEHSASGSNRLTIPTSGPVLYRYDGSNQSGGQYTVIGGAQGYVNAANTVVPAVAATSTVSGMYISAQFVVQHKPIP